MINQVLDASALLALINKEEGCEHVAQLLSSSLMSSVNVSECVAILSSIGLQDNDIKGIIGSLVPVVIDFDRAQSFEAGMLREKTKAKGLSLGDRACLALGRLKKLPVVTADKIWAEIECGVEVILIR
jgi:ribonuclease VapC